jgi:hypothetical protein
MFCMIRVAAICLVAVAGTLVNVAPAHAGVADVTCTPPSSNTATYDPPLTLTPQDGSITTETVHAPCVSLSVPALTSGLSMSSISVKNRSCLDLLGPGSSTSVITWNTGQTSALKVNYTATIAGAVYTVNQTGVVTSGLFAGDAVVRTLTGPATDILLCTAGLGTVSNLYTTVALEITSLP